MKHIVTQYLSSQLPKYVNGHLSPPENWLISGWLKLNPTARQQVKVWETIRTAVHDKPASIPSSEVFTQIQARIRVVSQPKTTPTNPVGFWKQWGWGMALVTLSLIILFNVLPPGIVLQWSAQGSQPVTFRVYRAPANAPETSFELVEEIAVANEINLYTYRDFILLPGQQFVYRVEAVGQDGLSNASQTIVSNSLEALPGQLALILSLLIVGYGMSLAIQRPKWLPHLTGIHSW